MPAYSWHILDDVPDHMASCNIDKAEIAMQSGHVQDQI
jgi:hypothetical protein